MRQLIGTESSQYLNTEKRIFDAPKNRQRIHKRSLMQFRPAIQTKFQVFHASFMLPSLESSPEPGREILTIYSGKRHEATKLLSFSY